MFELTEPLHPPSTWCKMKCIMDDEDCMHKEACGYRGKFLSVLYAKNRSAFKRHLSFNGDPERATINFRDLLGLARVYMKTGFTCWYCGQKMYIVDAIYNNNGNGMRGHVSENTFSLDHRVPLICGGTNHISNLVFCCYKCNGDKGNMLESEFEPVWRGYDYGDKVMRRVYKRA